MSSGGTTSRLEGSGGSRPTESDACIPNDCGTCGKLKAAPETPCGDCGRYACTEDGRNVTCVAGPTPAHRCFEHDAQVCLPNGMWGPLDTCDAAHEICREPGQCEDNAPYDIGNYDANSSWSSFTPSIDTAYWDWGTAWPQPKVDPVTLTRVDDAALSFFMTVRDLP